MGDMQHFCLRWNNYQSSITSAFENLRDDEDFVDVTLACDGKSLKAHRVVLSACSPYFRELLKSTPCKHPVIVLQDVTYEDLAALVEFIYHGEVNVRQRSLSSFLKTAEILRVSGLTQQSEAMSVGVDKRGLLDSSQSLGRKQQHPLHRQRERPSSVPNTPDIQLRPQDNLLSVKKCRSETSAPPSNHRSDTPLREPEEEPPVDFSTSGSNNLKHEVHSPIGQQPSVEPPGQVKAEPMELTPHISDVIGRSSEKEDSEESRGGGDYGDGTGPPDNPPTPDSLNHNYLESKLFAAAGAASFNFSMAAALAADSLAGLNNQHHSLPGADGMAGTSSQGLAAGRRWVAASRDKGGRPASNLTSNQCYQCDTCHKHYRTISSLRNHKSVYHRKTSNSKRKINADRQPSTSHYRNISHHGNINLHQN